MDLFNCSRDFLKSIYGEKYCRRVCSEVEMTSILTLLWISFEAAGIKHDFAEKEELYQYLRETFKIKAPDQIYHKNDTESLGPEEAEKEVVREISNVHEVHEAQVPDELEKIEEVQEVQEVQEVPEVSEVPEVPEVLEVQEVSNEFVEIELIVAPFISKKELSDTESDDEKDTRNLQVSEKMSKSDEVNKAETEKEQVKEVEGSDSDEVQDDNEYQDGIHPRIAELLAIPQPEQKSLAWLSQRQDYITASVFGASTGLLGPAALVTLLLDKISRGKLNPFGGNQATHWGEKYEPITNDLYCYRMRAKTYEFGMIAHPNKELNFLGASTDGIAIRKDRKDRKDRDQKDRDRKDQRLTNIEIKSPFSRHITGIPKPEYWAQMQLQMEILNLDETHFIESKFREYDMPEFWRIFDLQLYEIDDTGNDDDECEGLSTREYDAEGEALAYSEAEHRATVSKRRSKADPLQGDQVLPLRKLKKEERGIMIEAIALDQQENDGSPKRVYISSPIELYKNEQKLRAWYDEKMREFGESQTLVYLKSNGWIVERFSCVYVERDKIWFKNQIETVKHFWSDVLKYRDESRSLDQIARLKEPLLNKYRSMIATNAAANSMKARMKASATTVSLSNYTTKVLGTGTGSGSNTGTGSSNRRPTTIVKLDEDDEDSELPLGLGGCMLEASTPTSLRGSSTIPRKVSGMGLGFGCLLAPEGTAGTTVTQTTPQITPQTTPQTPKKKVSLSRKFF